MEYSSAKIKLLKTPLSEVVQSRGFLGRILEPLLKNCLALMKNVLKPLAFFYILYLTLIFIYNYILKIQSPGAMKI